MKKLILHGRKLEEAGWKIRVKVLNIDTDTKVVSGIKERKKNYPVVLI